MSASPAPSLLPDPVARWRDALDNLSPHASPCRYLVPAKWAAIREAGIEFCDRSAPRLTGLVDGPPNCSRFTPSMGRCASTTAAC